MIGRMLLMAIAIGIAQVAFTEIPNCLKPWEKVEGTEDAPTRCAPATVPSGCSANSKCLFSIRKFYYVCCQLDPTVFAESSVPGQPECCGPHTPVMGGVRCTPGVQNSCPFKSSCMESTNANITLCCEYDAEKAMKNLTDAVC